MRKIFGFLLILSFLGVIFAQRGFAQGGSILPVAPSVSVSAVVGEFYLSVSGYISPYATVVLSSDGVFYRAAVADSYGNFAISQVLIRGGFSHFCLEAVDFKRLGSSETCFSVPPASSDVVMRDIFLPPTIGLQRSEISAGSDALVFGYTMPTAQVGVHINTGAQFTVSADNKGYYTKTISRVKAGYYSLFADATYKGKPSVKPTKTIYLKVLSLGQQISRKLSSLWGTLVRLVSNPLWWLLPLLLLITYLILRIWPERFTFLYESKLFSYFLRRKRRLHHWWMKGVGY